jgi:hypothetical protein
MHDLSERRKKAFKRSGAGLRATNCLERHRIPWMTKIICGLQTKRRGRREVSRQQFHWEVSCKPQKKEPPLCRMKKLDWAKSCLEQSRNQSCVGATAAVRTWKPDCPCFCSVSKVGIVRHRAETRLLGLLLRPKTPVPSSSYCNA